MRSKRAVAKFSVASLLACVLGACRALAPAPDLTPGVAHDVWEAPVVSVDAHRLATSREEACGRLKSARVGEPSTAATQAGMLEADLAALRGVVKQQQVTLSFRDANPECLPHLAAGVQSKGHGVLQKTWVVGNLEDKDAALAGLVSDFFKRPPPGVKVAEPKLTLVHGEPVTCDYDLMDVLEPDGRRIPGESARERGLIVALNQGLPLTPRGHQDRIKHGAQASYPDYLRLHPKEEPLLPVLKPEAPITVLDADGGLLRLSDLSDVLDFYQCTGAGLVPEWRVFATEAKTGKQWRLRLPQDRPNP